MKRYIDLFKQQAQQKKSTHYLRKARKIGMWVIVISVVCIVLEWGIFFLLSKQLSDKEFLKIRYSSYIQQNQSLDKKISIFLYKYQLLQRYLKDDASIYYYYDLLSTLVTNTNSSALISAFTINKNHAVDFSVTFDSYEKAIGFMSLMESETFVEYFDELELKEFTISSGQNNSYTLDFSGKFKKVTNADQT